MRVTSKHIKTIHHSTSSPKLLVVVVVQRFLFSETMVTRTLLLLPFACAAAFTGQPLVSRAPSKNVATLNMGGAQGYASSLEGKKVVVDGLKGLLDSSEMIFTIPCAAIKVTQSQALRRSMPEGTTVKVVKNKLMMRAAEGTDFEAVSSLLQGANMWFFIENDISGTIKAYNSFLKDYSKQESNQILGGVMDSTAYDKKGIQDIGKLPSKQELYGKIAAGILAVPTKVARVIKAPNSKLARAIKLATEKEE
jgi:large subunit ribosomal protein L10